MKCLSKLNEIVKVAPLMTWEDVERLYSYIIFDCTHGGYIWSGCTNKNGYASITINYKQYYVHRLIKMLENSSWGNETIDHLCNNYICCTNCHLEWVTFEENCRRKLGTNCEKYHPGIPSLFKKVTRKTDSGTNKKGQTYTICTMCNRKTNLTTKCDLETFNKLSKKEAYFLKSPKD